MDLTVVVYASKVIILGFQSFSVFFDCEVKRAAGLWLIDEADKGEEEATLLGFCRKPPYPFQVPKFKEITLVCILVYTSTLGNCGLVWTLMANHPGSFCSITLLLLVFNLL
ncbi:uncharacterized protein LOC128034703 [Gossypium raimondii]|uniref:uncharacterized protein LOC128034703 n=1 Tax=Gossypium raimondii TaxID=29730 RepID=UPI00227D6F79|nr:uncharacterized protein LOC128034703 [Gossypium raimondii]